jgi:hypothetical protein
MKKDKAPILILDAANQPYLSVGRHFGGVKDFGRSYVYLPKEDAFIREDWMKEYKSSTWDEMVEKAKKSHL